MADPERPAEPEKSDGPEPESVAEPVVQEEPDRSEGAQTDPGPKPDPVEADVIDPPEPVSAKPVETVREIRVERKGGLLPMVAGGALAAALGYGLALYAPVSGLQGQAVDLSAVESRLSTLETAPDPAAPLLDRIAAVEARIDSLPPPTDAPNIAPVEAALADLTSRIDGMEQRFSVLESQPSADGTSSSPAMAAALETMRKDIESLKSANATAQAELAEVAKEAQARLAAAEEEAARLKAETEAAQQTAMIQAATGRLQAAVESGTPFADVLPLLADREIPETLLSQAETGVPSQSHLEDAFPVAARTALDVSIRATMGDSWSDRATALLRTATGARSLTPREGDDPDAVLSRAEAALKAGDLAAALTELSALPEPGQEAMADWVALAQRRLDAVAAVAALTDGLEG